MKYGAFFGNDVDASNECAERFARGLSEYLADKRSELGYNYLVGNLIGYNQHNTWFGEATKATPDGRYAGEPISFGIGQTDGRDREGLTAYLSSVAKMNANPILCGSTVTNVLLEESLIKVDANFDKLVMLMDTYFKMGGLHFQFTYVSKEDMKRAKVTPEKYKSLRVRVSGFSDYFNNLNSDLQDDMIKRTEKVN